MMIEIVVNGCNGRMGQTVVALAQENPDLAVVAGVDPKGQADPSWTFPTYRTLSDVEESAAVVVDFSLPEGTTELVQTASARGMGVVIATTGLDQDQLRALEEAATSVPILRAANMSLGINLLKALVKQAVQALGSTFDVEIVERHHRMKKDSPSGTALALADVAKEAAEGDPSYVHGRHGTDAKRSDTEIGIHAVRGGTIVGEHDVIFAGSDEVITLSHKAYSRKLFAAGALKAAQYLAGRKPGLYGMEDVIAGD